MSRSQKKSQSSSQALDKPAQGASPSASKQPATTSQPAKTPANLGRNRILMALGLAVVWYVVLISLASTTANPITLNPAQITKAYAVVLADMSPDGQATIKQSWKRELGETSIQLSDFKLPDGNPYPAGQYLIPLDKTAQGFEITKSLVLKNAKLVYPSSPALIAALEELLADK